MIRIFNDNIHIASKNIGMFQYAIGFLQQIYIKDIINNIFKS